MTAALTVDTNGTPPASETHRSQLDAVVAAVNDHASKLDTFIAAGDAQVAALIVGTPSITVAAQSSTHRDATIQLKDGSATALAAKAVARVWLSDAAGGAATASAPAGGLSFTTGTVVGTETANKVVDVISDATGVIVARLTDATGSISTTWYVNVAIGNEVVSAAVTITNA